MKSERRVTAAIPGAAVAQSCTRLYRRIAFCGSWLFRSRWNASRPCRSKIGDTAEFNSALRAFGLLLLLAVCLCGCAAPKRFVGTRPFDFQSDTISYPNDLVWEYHYDAEGKWVHNPREPRPDYTHHCFVVARSARQFFQNAVFDPTRPIVDDATYRRLIRRVVAVDPADPLPEARRIVFPGYANLREFSEARARLLKEECGGAWHSYVQRGHWRMIFPFSRDNQVQVAAECVADLKENRPPLVHVVRFPQLTINHAVLLYAAKETDKEILFTTYDPNKPEHPAMLTFDRATRTFSFPFNDYWPGGRLDVYEIYRSWKY
jgi:hypothetical protein